MIRKQANAKSFERARKRSDREYEAMKNGTWKHKKKARGGPHWRYWNHPDPDRCYCEYCYSSDCEADDMIVSQDSPT